MRDAAGDLQPRSVLLGAEAIAKAMAGERRIDCGRNCRKIFIAVVRPLASLVGEIDGAEFLAIGPKARP